MKLDKKMGIFLLFLFLINFSLIQSESKEDKVLNNDLVFVKEVENVQQFDKIEVSGEIFVPTNEWQTVEKNKAIPRGLHVRLNIQTGETEAKLLDKKTNEDKASKDEGDLSFKKLKEAIKQLNDEKINTKEEHQGNVKQEVIEKEDEVKKKFRSYEELKKDLDDMQLNVQTESEIFTSLIKQFNSTEDKDEKIRLLKDFEFYAHQYDNGLLLCDFGGFEMITRELNTTNDIEIKTESILVLGSALQSNPKVKVHAVRSEFLHLLLNQLSKSMLHSDLQTQNFVSRLVFTLSGLLRNFPFAQNQFIRFGGVEVLHNLLKKETYSVKLKVKVITLANDLLQEKLDATNIIQYETNTSSKNLQYLKVGIIQKLIEINWCDHFEFLLQNAIEHDTFEKLFDSTLGFFEHCRSNFKLSLFDALQNLNTLYTELSRDEPSQNEDDNYFLKLANKIRLILVRNDKTEL